MLFTRTTAELTINDYDDDDDDAQYNLKRFFLSDDTKKLDFAPKFLNFTHKNFTNNTQQHKKQLYKTHIKNARQTDGNTRVNERCDGIRDAGER